MVSRRTMLATTAGLAVGTMAADTMLALTADASVWPDREPRDPRPGDPRPTAAAPGGVPGAVPRGVPRTLSARRTLRRGSLRVASTDFRLTHLGVLWRGAAARVRLRTATGWGRWQALDGCGGRPDGRPPQAGALLVAPDTVGYDLYVSGGGTAQITELNTSDGPAVATAAAVAAAMPLPDGTACPVPYLSRAAWGADESLRFRNGEEYWPTEFAPTRTLTVHHTAGVNNDPNPAATVRAIYHFQAIVQDWGDIGYHVLIDEAGRAYEGRWSGADPVPVFGTNPGPAPMMTIAGHVLGFNVSNIGVCLLGDFTSRQPTAAALNSLTAVLTGLARVGRLNVLGSTTYTSTANGTTRTARNLAGHRNWAATECPGDLFYPRLDALRENVAFLAGRPTTRPRPPSGPLPRPPSGPLPRPPTGPLPRPRLPFPG